jgi:hypothetical protein
LLRRTGPPHFFGTGDSKGGIHATPGFRTLSVEFVLRDSDGVQHGLAEIRDGHGGLRCDVALKGGEKTCPRACAKSPAEMKSAVEWGMDTEILQRDKV